MPTETVGGSFSREAMTDEAAAGAASLAQTSFSWLLSRAHSVSMSTAFWLSIFVKSSSRGVISSPAMSMAPGLTIICASPWA